MRNECEIVQDLIPLYTENMASNGSRELVESHTKTCENCRRFLRMEDVPLDIPAEVDTGALKRIKRDLRKRTLYPVLLSVFLALTVFCGMLVCALIPVMADYHESVLAVEEKNEEIRVHAADSVTGIVSINSSFYFQKMRLDWFYSERMHQYRSENNHWFSLHYGENESVWYCGIPTGNEDVLVWGDGKQPLDTGIADILDKTIVYICNTAFLGAAVLIVLGILLRKRKIGIILIHFGMALLLCCLSCLFVTDGHLVERAIRSGLFRFEPMIHKLISIGVLTLLSWLSWFSGYKTVKLFKK